VKVVPNVPLSVLNAIQYVKTAATISSAGNVKYASNAAAVKATTAKNAAYVNSAWSSSATTVTVAHNVPMSVRIAARNAQTVPNLSSASSVTFVLIASAVRETTAPNV